MVDERKEEILYQVGPSIYILFGGLAAASGEEGNYEVKKPVISFTLFFWHARQVF